MNTPVRWQKSSFSGSGDGNACIELAATNARIHLRESDDPAKELAAGPKALADLLRAIKADTR